MKQNGVSLVEVLIALLVLMLGIAAIVRFQGGALESRGLISQNHEAIQIAEDRLEQLRDYEVLDTTSGKTAYQDIVSGNTTVTKASATYTVTWTVSELSNPDHKTVTVTVSWTDRKNTARSIVLSSIIGKIDPANAGAVMQGL